MKSKDLPSSLKRRQIALALSAAALGISATRAAQAQSAADYPNKAVKVVVSFTAGGTTDIIARSVGNLMAEQLKQSFVIENKPGSGGNIGNEMVARSPADGYTLTVASVGAHGDQPHSLQRSSVRSLN